MSRFLAMRVALLTAVTLLLACEHSTAPDTTVARIELAADGSTVLQVRQSVQLVATAYTANNTVLPNAPIRYRSSDTAVAQVSVAGYVTARTSKGVATITAWVDSITSPPVTITIAVGLPYQVDVVQGIPFDALVGSTNLVRFKVVDRLGSPVPNISVTFNSDGRGTTTPDAGTTDNDGLVETHFTLGTKAGESNSLWCVTAHPDSSVVGKVSIAPLPGPPTRLFFPSQYAFSVAGVEANLHPTLLDAYDNQSMLNGVTYIIRTSGIISLSREGRFTTIAPGQTVLVAKTENGLSDSMVVAVQPANGFGVGTRFSQITYAPDIAVEAGLFLSPGGNPEPVGAATIRVTWDPSVLIYQGITARHPEFDPIVNETTAGSGSITLAFASATGLSYTAELIRLAFRTAPGANGAHGTVKTEVIEMAGARSFGDLLPVTTGFFQLIGIRR